MEPWRGTSHFRTTVAPHIEVFCYIDIVRLLVGGAFGINNVKLSIIIMFFFWVCGLKLKRRSQLWILSFCQNVRLEVRILVHTTDGNLKLEITHRRILIKDSPVLINSLIDPGFMLAEFSIWSIPTTNCHSAPWIAVLIRASAGSF